jgi:hypothetical protein
MSKFLKYSALLNYSALLQFSTFFSLLLLSLQAQAGTEKADPKAAASTPPTDAEPAHSSFECEADVFYKWQRNPSAHDNNTETVPAATEEVFFEKQYSSAATKEEAEAALKSNLVKTLAMAREECIAEHHGHSSCLEKKLNSINFSELDFETRRELRSQIKEDCISEAGRCLETKHSEPHCIEKSSPSPAAAAPSKDAKAEEKKK